MKIRNFTNRVADVKKALLRKMGSLNNELFWGLAESLAVALSGAILLIAAGRTHEGMINWKVVTLVLVWIIGMAVLNYIKRSKSV